MAQAKREYVESNTNAEHYLERVERLLGEMETLKGQYMQECKSFRADIKSVYHEAKKEGVEIKALKGLVKYRALEKKQIEIPTDFDELVMHSYEDLIERLGDLGRAAAERAGYRHSDGDGDELAPLT